MSALAGIFNRRGEPPTDAALARVLAPVQHRGPDHIGRYRDQHGFAMCVALLTTTPEDVGATQPLVDGGTCIGFDGRIDNREELLRTLGPRDRPSQRAGVESDAELALRAFFRWGDGFPAQLVGDFAAAIWQPERRRLLLTRDVCGVRALLYYADEKRVVFGTEIAQVIGHPDVPVRPNEAIVAEYLACDLQSQEETLYAGVKRVLPRHCLVFEATGDTGFAYWDVDPTKRVVCRDEVEYVALFRETFVAATRAQMRCSTRVGAQLSGGLDSSCVVGAASRISGAAGVHAYSLVFPGETCDETPYIDEVASALGIACTRFAPASAALEDPLVQARAYRDLPDYPNAALHVGLNRLARRDGARVLLTGEGGDEFWSGGFGHAVDLLAGGRVLQSIRTSRWDSRIPSFTYPRFGFLRMVVAPLLPTPITTRLRALRRRGLRRRANPPATILGARLAGFTTRGAPSVLAGANHAQQEAYADIYNGWSAHGDDSGGRLVGRFQLSQRAPFFDRRMMELAFAFPEHLKKRRETPKYAMREAFRGVLPRRVLERRDKAGFSASYTRVLRQFGHRLHDPAIARSGWVNKSRLTDIYSLWHRNPGRYGLQLWMALAVESWYKAVII